MSDSSDELFDLFLADAEQPFAGWDFAYLADTGRMASEPLPWSYASVVLPHLRRVRAALDMGTGGGELLALLRPFPPRMCATEGYAPNVPIARARLEPLDVAVYAIGDDDLLPFADAESFDLVINRHESYAPGEVARVLRPGGRFITQQVGVDNDVRLNELLGIAHDVPWQHWRLATARAQLETAGFRVSEAREAFPNTRFYDIGAVAYYLNAVPWQAPGFSVPGHRDALRRIHQLIEREGHLEVANHRFFLVAQKGDAGRA